MTEPDPVTEAEGTVTTNTENPPSEDKFTTCGTGKSEHGKELNADKQTETKEEKSTYGKEENEDKKILNKKNDEKEVDGGGEKEGEVEVGDGKKEDGAKVVTEKKVDGAEVVDENKECEVKENRDEKKEGNATKDVEEKDGEHQNGLNLENIGVKDDTQTENMGETEDVKMEDAEHVKGNNAEDVKMEDADDVKNEEKGVKTDEQGAQNRTENDVNKDADGEAIVEKVYEYKEADEPKKKRPRSKKSSQKGERKDTEGETRAKELMRSPSSIDRPVRERKTVERLVEVIEKEPNREFQVEKVSSFSLKFPFASS